MKIRKLAHWCRRAYFKFINQHYWHQFIGFFRHAREYRSYSSKKKIYVVSTPEYGNLGDHAIAIAEVSLLKKLYPDYDVVEIGDIEFLYHYRCLIYYIKKEDLICLIGGGNFGVIYPEIEFVRRKMITAFPQNKIIMFPQTMDFGSGEYAERELLKSKKIYQDHNKLFLMAREKKSYDLMKETFRTNRVFLAPDVVLSWKPEIHCSWINKRVLLCYRNDGERVMGSDIRERISTYLEKNGFQTVYTDTEKNKRIEKKERKDEVYAMLREIASAQFVITDRLHGMILSCICGTPCLAFDNKNKKISGVSEWIHNLSIQVCTDTSKLEEQISSISRKAHFEFDNSEYMHVFSDVLKDVI